MNYKWSTRIPVCNTVTSLPSWPFKFNIWDGEQSQELNINLPRDYMVIEWDATVHVVDNETKNLL